MCSLATLLLARWKIDDVVGAVPVHAIAGVWGTLAVALLGSPAAWDNGNSRLDQFLVQALGAATCFVWAFGCGFVVLWLLNRLVPLRVDAEAERLGLNVAEHDAGTELLDLLNDMHEQSRQGDFSQHVRVEPHTEVGCIAQQYNQVLDRVNQEICQRERAGDALRRAEEKYRSIFENAIEGIFQTTPDGRYLSANPALARIYGYASVEQLLASVQSIGQQLYVDPQRRDEFVALMQQHDMVVGFVSQVRRADGQVVWISENARVVRDETGRIAYYEGSVEDITQRKETADLFQQKEAAEAPVAPRASSSRT